MARVTVPRQSVIQQVARLGPLVPLLTCAGFSQSVLTAALPYITNDLNGLSLYSWVTWAYMIPLALAVPVWAYVSARWPQRSLLRVSILLYIIGLGISGLSALPFFNATRQTVMYVFLSGRSMQGIGMSGAATWIFALISGGNLIADIKLVKNFLIIFPVVYFFGLVTGPYLGDQISTHLSWRWIFALLFVIAFVVLFLERQSKFDEASNEQFATTLVLTIFFVLMPVISFLPYAVTAFLFFRRASVPVNHAAS